MSRIGRLLAGCLAYCVPLVGTGCEVPDPPQREEASVAVPWADRVERADAAITKLDVERGAELLQGTTGPAASRAKARLAVYMADCEGALSHLASEGARAERGAGELLNLAQRCHGATAGAVVVEDERRGIWLRLQDEADRVLAPLIIETSVAAREALERDLGVDLPRPLRIDLVRDLFSLSAVSGLPLEAAETTGTVAVARWGRVTIISPRATYRGYPWADTLAHEITHLLLSRATSDRAPLWLQEGIAKREETRWREQRPFDRDPDPGLVAAQAERSGQSVGVTKIGPSIAMLPSARAASIAFAEVTSLMEYWIEQLGPHGLPLLLREVEVTRDADKAMRAVSGLGIEDWEHLWRAAIRERFAETPISDLLEPDAQQTPRKLARTLRLSELLFAEGHAHQAAEFAAPEIASSPGSAALRFSVARAALEAGWGQQRLDPDVLELEPQANDLSYYLGELEDVEGAHGGWLALRSRLLRKGQSDPAARRLLEQAIGLDPLLAEVACGGVPFDGEATRPPPDYLDPDLNKLCQHARSLVVRGSR